MFEYSEIYDRTILLKIIDNLDYFLPKLGRWVDAYNNYEVIQDTKTIKTLIKSFESKKIQEYRHSKNDIENKGRLFAPNSLQSMSRVFRHTLCKGLCKDIDIKNAHNVFLVHYCKNHNIDSTHLEYYNDNRKDLLESLTRDYNFSKDEGKRIVLTMINGGNIDYYFQGTIPPQWIGDLKTELKVIHKTISKLEPQRFLRSKSRNPKNPYGTCVNTILCEMENSILQRMIEFCNINNVRISTLCFDGILIENVDIDLIKMSDFVFETTQIKVEIVEKEMDEGIDKSEFEIITNFKTSTDKYVDSNVFKCDDKVILIKAGLGMGKSTATISYINETDYKRIIIYTPRKTYAASFIDRLNRDSKYKDWELYSESKDLYIKANHLVVQCESIYRVSSISYEDTLIVIDECESFLTCLTNVKTNKHHESTIALFESLLSCKKVICLDAFMSNKTTSLFTDLKIQFQHIDYTNKLKVRHYIEIEAQKGEDLFEVWMKRIFVELSEGKKMYVFISSLRKLTIFRDTLKTNMSNLKYLEYSSKVKNSLIDVNTLWKEMSLILTTSSLTVGVNFDVPDYFDSIGVFANAPSMNLVRDIFQSTYRVRHLKEDLMIFAVDEKHYGSNLETTLSAVVKSLDDKQKNIIRLYEAIHKEKHPKSEGIPWFFNLMCNNTLESNLSIMQMKNVFREYLDKCNYIRLEENDESLETDFDFEQTDRKDTILIEYSDIPVINSNEMKELRRKPIKTEMESLSIEKFHFLQTVEDVPTSDEAVLWSIYFDFGRSKFRNLNYEKGIIKETINMAEIMDTTLPIIATNMGLQLSVIRNISNWFEVKHSQDFETLISKEKLHTLIPMFKDNMKAIYDAFNLRSTTKDDEWDIRKITEITNSVLDRWGFSKLKMTKKDRCRKGPDMSEYKLVNRKDETIFDKLKGKKGVNHKCDRLLKRKLSGAQVTSLKDESSSASEVIVERRTKIISRPIADETLHVGYTL